MSFKKERNFRCSCCNKVASKDIATDLFELNPELYFKVDPHDITAMLCSECIDIINATVSEFDDEISNLEEDYE